MQIPTVLSPSPLIPIPFPPLDRSGWPLDSSISPSNVESSRKGETALFLRKIKDQSINYSDRLEAARTSEELMSVIDMMITVIQLNCRSIVFLQSR